MEWGLGRLCSGLMTRLEDASLCPDWPCCPSESHAATPLGKYNLTLLGQAAWGPDLASCLLKEEQIDRFLKAKMGGYYSVTE